jgi:flagella basal body P-ring formation protein FlgA
MSNRKASIIAAACIIISVQLCNASVNSTGENSILQICLAETAAIGSKTISLGQVCRIEGEKGVAAKAGEIRLGEISAAGQEVVVDRQMILSRLACNGIPASAVELRGAERTVVRQQQQVVKGSELVEAARVFLEKNFPKFSGCKLESVRTPKDFVTVGENKNIELVPRFGSSMSNQVRVKVMVLVDNKESGSSDVDFYLKYNCRTAVTLTDIPAGAVISPENTKIEQGLSDSPEPSDWRAPYGLIARYRLPANTVIRANMVNAAKAAAAVKRNETVIIRVEKPGLSITAVGKAMQDGRAGECIKVRNVDSQRVILAKVCEDGTVEPVL